jgi:hypothetical protein
VEERIRRAQMAVLNPNTPELTFLDEDHVEPQTNQLSFSSDLVSVRISGRDIDDLSFVDLPGACLIYMRLPASKIFAAAAGIIASVREGSDESDIQQVKSLVSEYIKKPSCLILMITSCESEFYTAVSIGPTDEFNSRHGKPGC